MTDTTDPLAQRAADEATWSPADWLAGYRAALADAAPTMGTHAPEAGTLTPEGERHADFVRNHAVFRRVYAAWKNGGRHGPPPPRPIPPHTPGWLARPSRGETP